MIRDKKRKRLRYYWPLPKVKNLCIVAIVISFILAFVCYILDAIDKALFWIVVSIFNYIIYNHQK